MFFTFLGLTCNSYCFEIVAHGLDNYVPGLIRHLLLSSLLAVVLLTSFTLLIVYFMSSLGLDLVVGEALLYILFIGSVIFSWARNLIKILKVSKPLISQEKLDHVTQVENRKIIIVKKKGFF